MKPVDADCWTTLGIAPTQDQRDIKRAYSTLLKSTRPDDDPRGFQALRTAYQAALAQAAPAGPATPSRSAAPEVAEQQVGAPEGCDTDAGARALWNEVLAAPADRRMARLTRIAGGEAMFSLALSQAFEFCAAEYCAQASCADDIRQCAVLFFDWERDSDRLLAWNRPLAEALLSRYRASRSWSAYASLALRDKPLRYLLANKKSGLSFSTFDKQFMQGMGERLKELRQFHPEMVAYKLDPAVLGWWESRVDSERYYLQTAVDTFVRAVMFCFFAALLPTRAWGWRSDHVRTLCLGVAAIVVISSILTTFAKTLGLQAAINKRAVFFQRTVLGRLRSHRFVESAWVPAYLAMTPLAFAEELGASDPYWFACGFAVLACWSIFAASAYLHIGEALFVSLVTAALAGISYKYCFELGGYFATLTALLPTLIIGALGPRRTWSILRLPTGLLPACRRAWCAGLAILFILAISPLSSIKLEMLEWCWVCTGLVVTEISLSAIAAFILASAILFAWPLFSMDPHPPSFRYGPAIWLPVLLFIAYHTAQNLRGRPHYRPI